MLHACCHNPTGVDLNLNDWKQILEVLRARDHVPFIDIAYQGFGDSIEEDAAAVRLFAESGMTFFVSSSFSKSSLYGERVGAPCRWSPRAATSRRACCRRSSG